MASMITHNVTVNVEGSPKEVDWASATLADRRVDVSASEQVELYYPKTGTSTVLGYRFTSVLSDDIAALSDCDGTLAPGEKNPAISTRGKTYLVVKELTPTASHAIVSNIL